MVANIGDRFLANRLKLHQTFSQETCKVKQYEHRHGKTYLGGFRPEESGRPH